MSDTYSVRMLEGATRDLQRLDRAVARRIAGRLQWLAENLDAIKPVPLAGEQSGLYRLREGDYRIIYEVLHEERLIVVHCIGHRSDIYRRG